MFQETAPMTAASNIESDNNHQTAELSDLSKRSVPIVLEMYNGLVQLRISIERARANVSALLKMRFDLIPALDDVVRAYRQYEHDLREKVAALREERIGGANQVLQAVSEQYPELKADEHFGCLHKQLAAMEDRIAGSRRFVNDSVMLYNRKLESIPYLFFAGPLGMHKAPYLET